MNNYQGDALPEQERQMQIREARRLSGQDGLATTSNPKPRPRGGIKNKNPDQQTLKGHDAFLDALRANKTLCMFEWPDGSQLIGVIAHSDASTISVLVRTGVDPLRLSELPRVIYQSNLKLFEPLHKQGQ